MKIRVIIQAISRQTDWILTKTEAQELQLCLLLKPCKEATELVSGFLNIVLLCRSSYVTISLVRCQFKILISQLGVIAASTQDPVTTTGHKMILDLNTRIGPLSHFLGTVTS